MREALRSFQPVGIPQNLPSNGTTTFVEREADMTALHTQLQHFISIALIFEYEEVLKRNREQLSLTLLEIDTFLNGICTISNHRDIFYLWRPLAKDPNDDFLIDLAIKSQASFLITYNQKDLQQATQFGIQVITPKTFLQLIGELPS